MVQATGRKFKKNGLRPFFLNFTKLCPKSLSNVLISNCPGRLLLEVLLLLELLLLLLLLLLLYASIM